MFRWISLSLFHVRMKARKRVHLVVITDKVIVEYGHQLILRPRTYTMGIDCRRDTPKELILDAIQQSLAAHKLSTKEPCNGCIGHR